MSNHNETIDFTKFKVSCSACSLRELCLPMGLSNDDLQQLESTIKRPRPIQKGDYLFRMGDDCHSLYTVRAGSVKTLISTDEGEEQIMGFHLPGEMFGLDGLETDIHTCSAMALETTSVCELPIHQFETLCQSIPGLSHQMHRLIGKEVTTDHEMLFLLGKKDAEERLSSFLLSISKRLSQRGFSANEFYLSMSRQDIGNYLGLALETVSRQFTHFQDAGILSVERRHITIHQIDRLKQIAIKSTHDMGRHNHSHRHHPPTSLKS